METVTLCRCTRCHLQWVEEARFKDFCPFCMRRFSVPRSAVVAGVEVQVEAVVLRGDDMGLHDPDVVRGLDKLALGMRCEHGYIAPFICPSCNNIYKVG